MESDKIIYNDYEIPNLKTNNNHITCDKYFVKKKKKTNFTSYFLSYLHRVVVKTNIDIFKKFFVRHLEFVRGQIVIPALHIHYISLFKIQKYNKFTSLAICRGVF